MTMTSASATSSRPDLAADLQTMPPFVACDDLDQAVALLDDWVSTFVGRMVPYCNGLATVREERPDDLANAEKSGLENRIYATALRIHAIRGALDVMNTTLRL